MSINKRKEIEKTRKSEYITYTEDKCFLKLLFQVREHVQLKVIVKGM